MTTVSLQTLGFRPPLFSRRHIRVTASLLSPFPTTQPPFHQHHPVPSAISWSSTAARLSSCLPRATGGPDQVDESRYYAKESTSSELFFWANNFLNFAGNNFLPLALVSGIFVGLANPSLGHLADRYPLSKFSTVGIFLVSGLMLRSEEIGAAREAWPALIFGLASILLLTPFFARVILQVHLNPHEFVTGLGIFCCMPTTLSSGVALTQLVGGNSALALAMTVISNFLGTLTVPLSLAKFIGVGFSVPTMQLCKSLIMTLLVPLALGKVLRDYVKMVAIYVDQNRKCLSVISAILLSLVPAAQVSRSKALLFTVRPEVFATAVGMGALLHVTLLAFNTVAVQILSMLSGGGKESVFAKKENARALIIVASQKTLPVMVAVVEQLGGALGEPALLILPCVAAHINQIILDSFLVNWWKKDLSPSAGKAHGHAKPE